MKILHTADWHLGKRLEHFSRLEEQREVMDEIVEIADSEQVDAVIIAGDLFDTFNPATEAVELFYRTLKRLSANGKRPVVAIAGNHDSPDRIEAPNPLARENGILFSGYPSSQMRPLSLESGLQVTNSEPGFVELKLPTVEYPLRLLLTPYANEFRLRKFLGADDEEEALRQLLKQRWNELSDKWCDNSGVNILMTHLFMIPEGAAPPEEPDDEKPILHVGGAQVIYKSAVPDAIQYTALGHLHRYRIVGNEAANPAVYTGSPLSYSFSEAGQDKFVVIVDAEPGKAVSRRAVKLNGGKKLFRKRFETVDKAIEWLEANPDTLVELTLVADEYLKAADRKRLQRIHDGIVTIIPEIRRKGQEERAAKQIDLKQDMDELFRQYFSHEHGQDPNQELMELFREIKAEKGSK